MQNQCALCSILDDFICELEIIGIIEVNQYDARLDTTIEKYSKKILEYSNSERK